MTNLPTGSKMASLGFVIGLADGTKLYIESPTFAVMPANGLPILSAPPAVVQPALPAPAATPPAVVTPPTTSQPAPQKRGPGRPPKNPTPAATPPATPIVEPAVVLPPSKPATACKHGMPVDECHGCKPATVTAPPANTPPPAKGGKGGKGGFRRRRGPVEIPLEETYGWGYYETKRGKPMLVAAWKPVTIDGVNRWQVLSVSDDHTTAYSDEGGFPAFQEKLSNFQLFKSLPAGWTLPLYDEKAAA